MILSLNDFSPSKTYNNKRIYLRLLSFLQKKIILNRQSIIRQKIKSSNYRIYLKPHFLTYKYKITLRNTLREILKLQEYCHYKKTIVNVKKTN